MQLKIYVPTTIEIPSEYLTALAKRALDSLGPAGAETRATRGHLVRQAVVDGLLRDLDSLRQDDVVDLFCDPQGEAPLEIDNRSLNLPELVEALQSSAKAPASGKRNDVVEGLRSKEERVLPFRRAA